MQVTMQLCQTSAFQQPVPAVSLRLRSATLDTLCGRHLGESQKGLLKVSESGKRAAIVRAANGNGARMTESVESQDVLQDPAHIWARKSKEIPVRDLEGEVGLDAYMRLPVTQYNVLDPNLIKFVGGNTFLLHVPRINLLNVWVEPIATITVDYKHTHPPCVVLKTESCRIEGSELLQSLNLDKRFCLSFEATLTWQSHCPLARERSTVGQHSANGSSHQVVNAKSTLRQRMVNGRPRIHGDARLDVWCEVVPPFNLMPRPVLEGSCNVALEALMQLLLPLFMNKLGSDYREWAKDANYRQRRSTVNLQPSAL